MAFSYQEIVNLSANLTCREIADRLGITHSSASSIDSETYLKNEGGRIVRLARDEVAAGNGHVLLGTRKSRGNGGGGNGASKSNGAGKTVDPLSLVDDEVRFAAFLAAKKAGVPTNGVGIKEAIEDGNKAMLDSLGANLSQEQIDALKNALGVMSAEEREAKRREELIAFLRMEVLKAARLNSIRNVLESAGFGVDTPVWFDRISEIDIENLGSKSTTELAEMADRSKNRFPARIRRDAEIGTAALVGLSA